ncbi:hypothetical protein Pmani_013283 [Petrolisthes manimaculis]|uniref:Uncharacterized protein n=1 Tax=Petrolisthes manimaculis TaxID=1843537 RepID=A0AAE1PVJ5_9EUCA|nr:hypothetical protein Pmani_013283 [Petrolisthes manimaculis]
MKTMKEAEKSGVDQVMGEAGDAGWLGREGEDRVVVPAGYVARPPVFVLRRSSGEIRKCGSGGGGGGWMKVVEKAVRVDQACCGGGGVE